MSRGSRDGARGRGHGSDAPAEIGFAARLWSFPDCKVSRMGDEPRLVTRAPCPVPRSSASRGFTLLELIVAVAVFAVVATLAYSGLDLMLRSRASLEGEADRQRAVELAVLGLERDLRQALARPVRGPYGEEQPALMGSAGAAEWTVLDLTSSRDGVHPVAGRVRYAVVDGALWRARDPVLDRSPRESARNRRVLADVQRMSFRYVASARQRLDQWPPRTGITAPERLPRAVEVTLVLADRGEISRLIELPESPR